MRALRMLPGLILVLALALVPASAQMDPRWRTATDVTDLFRSSGPSEVLWVLDFSPASSALAWHPYYDPGPDGWANFRPPARTRDYPRDDPDRDCVCFRYTLAWSAPARYTLTVRACWTDGGRDTGGAYPFYGMEGPLVAADGAVIDQAYLLARHETLPSAPGARDGSIGHPATWIKHATHARIHSDGRSRFPYTAYCGADLPGAGRTVDLPLPWRLLESPDSVVPERCDDPGQGGYPAFGGFVYANHSPGTCADAGSPGADRIPLDTTGWAGHRPGGAPRPEVGSPGHADAIQPEAVGILAVEGGAPILYHTDYLFWIFFGTAGSPSRKDDAFRPPAMVPVGSHVIPQAFEPNRKGLTGSAWQNGLPARCRFQAVKAALITAWFGTLPGGARVRDGSRWAFRFLDPEGEEAPGRTSFQNDAGLGRERSLRLMARAGDLAELQRKVPGRDPGRGAAGTWALANALAQMDATARGGGGASVFDPRHTGLAEAPCGASLLVLVAASRSWGPGPLPARPFRITARGGAVLHPPRPVAVWAIEAGLGCGAGGAGRIDPALLDQGTSGPELVQARHEAALAQAVARVAERASPAGDAGGRWAPAGSLARLTVGGCAYLGVFHPSGRTRWGGDLLMTGLRPEGAGAVLVDREGGALDGLDGRAPDAAVWAASRILAGYGSADRRLGRVHTLLPGAAALVPVAPGDPAWLGELKRAMADPPADPVLVRCLWSVLGGDTTRPEARGAGTGSYPMRGDAMGDIVNSTPAMLTYAVAQAERVPELREYLAAARAAGARPRFRVLFAGTNQGHLHAFGEVSWDQSVAVADGQATLPRGGAVELWSFMPPEAILNPWLLGDLDPVGRPNARPNPHPALVDGIPMIYFNPRRRPGAESPPVCRSGDTALLVFGLGKGGRSTYCLDVADPLRPVLKWALRPDEVTAAGHPLVRSMGLATSRPAIARALDGRGRVADFLVLGGGLSTPELEAGGRWSASDPPRPFGRCLVLFDVNRGPGEYRAGPGNLIVHGDPAMAAVSAGGAPLELFPGSGLAQRVYCADRAGGIWVLGARDGSFDTSRAGDWGLRPVFRPRDRLVASTLPEVFTLPGGRIPGTRTPAVGIAAGTGDRNNPLDVPGPGSRPGGPPHRLLLLFDPGEPARWPAGLDEGLLADLARPGSAENLLQVDPRTLAPALLGCRLDLPRAGPRRAQLIHDPLAAGGALFFSVFTPDRDPGEPCGPAGRTETFRIARAWHPRFPGWAAAGFRLEAGPFEGLAGELRSRGGGLVSQTGDLANVPGAPPVMAEGRYRAREPAGPRIRAWSSIPAP